MKSILNFKLAPLAATMILMVNHCKGASGSEGQPGAANDEGHQEAKHQYRYEDPYSNDHNQSSGEDETFTPDESDICEQLQHADRNATEKPFMECKFCGKDWNDPICQHHWDGPLPQRPQAERTARRIKDLDQKIKQAEQSVSRNAGRSKKPRGQELKPCEHNFRGNCDHEKVTADLLIDENTSCWRKCFTSKYCDYCEICGIYIACCAPVTLCYNLAKCCKPICRDEQCQKDCAPDGDFGCMRQEPGKAAITICVQDSKKGRDECNKGMADAFSGCFGGMWGYVKEGIKAIGGGLYESCVEPCYDPEKNCPQTVGAVLKNSLTCLCCPITKTWYYVFNFGCCDKESCSCCCCNECGPCCCKKVVDPETGILESDCSLLGRETGPCMKECCPIFWKGLWSCTTSTVSAVGKCVTETSKCAGHCVWNFVKGTGEKIIYCPSGTVGCLKNMHEEGPCKMCQTRCDQETGSDDCDKGCKCFWKELCGWCWCCCQVTAETGDTIEGCMALCELLQCLGACAN